jgi:ParB/RepB/Spo0J family partition protein
MYETLEQADEYKEIAVSAISRTAESMKEGRGDPGKDPAMENLIRDIKNEGLSHPPTVEVIEGTDKGPADLIRYRIIIGNRRFEAVKLAGYPTIKCLIRPGLTSRQKDTLAFSENIHRRGYTPYELAKVIERMVADWGGDRTALAKALGYTSAAVINDWLSPLGLTPEAAEELKKAAHLPPRAISRRHTLVSKLPPALQKEAAEIINEKATTDHEVRKIVNVINQHQGEPVRVVVERFLREPKTITVLVSLSEPVHTALGQAADEKRLTKARVAEKAIEEFLTNNGYLTPDGTLVKRDSVETTSTASGQ